MPLQPEDKAQFFKTMKLKLNRCLSHDMKCANTAIRAHSVQKATALALIEENAHVSELKIKIVDEQPTCEFTLVGRNNASTFTGLCSQHDTQISLPIDTKPLVSKTRNNCS